MTTNNGYYPHGRAMFSPQALAAFKTFCAVDAATAAQRPKGAQDAQHPRLARAIARDRKLARDDLPANPSDMTQPLPAHVNEMCDAVKKAGGDVKQFEHFLHSIWPGVADFRRTLDDELDPDEQENNTTQAEDMVDPEEPDDANPNAWQGLGGRGNEAFSKDNGYPQNAGRNIGGPKPFPGMPKRNGEMSMDSAMADYDNLFPMAKRIGLDPTPGSGSHSAAVTPTTMRTSRRGLAMDQKQYASGAAEDYARLFGSSNVRVL